MPDFVVDPATGATLSIPDQFAQYIGLPRAPVDEVYDPSITDAPLVQGQPRQSIDDMLAYKRKQYQEAGASPDQMTTWLEHDRHRYEASNREQSKPPPGSPPEVVDAWLAQSPSHEPGTPTQYIPHDVQERLAALSAPPSGVANLTQSTQPLGAIGEIGRDGSGALPAQSQAYATQEDLDAALAQPQAMTPPAPGTPPEQAGADQQRAGLAMQGEAATQSAAADSKAADAEMQAIAARNAEAERIRKETATQEAARQKRYEELNEKYSNATDEWAKTKIDPGRRWKNASTGAKIAAAISVAMSALGDALQHKSGPNLALSIIDKAIQDDIDLQVQDREHKGAIANRVRTSLDDHRKETADWREARQLKLAEEYKRTADEIERIAAGARSEKAKANGLAMAGEYRTRAGALEQGVATAAWNREMKAQEFAEQKRNARVSQGLQARGLKQQANQFSEEMKFKRDQLAAQQKAATDQDLATATAEQAKDLRESGIRDPSTGQYIVGEGGKPVLMRNAAEGAKIQETVDATQTMLSTIDRIKAKIANDPGFAKLNPTQKQAAIASELDSLTLLIKDSYGTGALDKGSIEFTNSYTGGDPTKLTAKGLFGALGLGADAGDKTVAKLDVVAKTAETRALNRLGNPKGWKFTRDEKVQDTPTNKAAESVLHGTVTTAKALQDQEPGFISEGLQDIGGFLTGTTPAYKTDRKNAAESGNSARFPGFRKDKEKPLTDLVNAANAGDAQAKARIVEMVSNQKIPGLSEAAMTLVEAHAPELLPQALAALPAEKRALRQAVYAARAAAGAPSINLYPGHGVPLKEKR